MPAAFHNHRLYILRHAHSSWARPGQRDHERPLDERGREEARSLAALIGRKGYRFDVAVCSTATRARETYDLIRPKLGPDIREETSDGLYALGIEAYYSEARRHGGSNAVLLVGHNPMIEEFTLSVAGNGEPAAMQAVRTGFPTCGLAIVEFSQPLGAIAPGAGHLRQLLDPDDLVD